MWLFNPFMDAWLGRAVDQLMGQIASAKIPLSRMISPQLYWVMSGDEFSLDINNPDDLKVLVVGNIFSGQVVGETAKTLSDRFGKVLQKRQSMTINRNDKSTSISI